MQSNTLCDKKIDVEAYQEAKKIKQTYMKDSKEFRKFQEKRYRNTILNIALRWPRPASIWRLSAAPGSGWVLISVSFENCAWYLLTAGVP